MSETVLVIAVGLGIAWLIAWLIRHQRTPATDLASVYAEDRFLPVNVAEIGVAIARAEGWFTPGSLPQRLNNPGALKDSSGQLRSFSSAEEGWSASYNQVRLMLTGESRYYNPDMPIIDIAWIYTGGDNPAAWASTVAGELGIEITETLNDYLAAARPVSTRGWEV